MKRQRSSGSPPLTEMQSAVAARLAARTLASGQLAGPCLPSLHGSYLKKLDALFAIMDRPLAEERREALGKLLAENLEQGFAATPHARITIDYRPIDGEPPGVHCDIKLEGPGAEDLHLAWLAWLGGPAPEGLDETLLQLVRELGLPGRARALDVGPGARHAVPLTAQGLRVEAFEPLGVRARELLASSASRALALKVIEQNALDEATQLAPERYDLIVLADLAPRLSPSELQQAIEKLAPALTRGGKLLLNVFVLEAGREPSAAEKERARSSFCTYVADSDLAQLIESSGLKLLSKRVQSAQTERALAGRSSAVAATARPNAQGPSFTAYARWCAGERATEPNARPLALRLNWLCLTNAD
jgi:hypothetical protein